MIHTVLTTLLDTLFPPPPEVFTLRNTTTTEFLNHLQRQHVRGVLVLSHYREPTVRAAIHAHKFYKHRHAKALLVALLEAGVSTLPNSSFLIPIPLARKRERERGYNQVTSLLCASTRGNQVIADLLWRTRNTTEQSHLARSERLTNVHGAFAYNRSHPPEQFAHRHLVVVDDVMTTGTTLQEAATTLRHALPASATVTCLALAH